MCVCFSKNKMYGLMFLFVLCLDLLRTSNSYGFFICKSVMRVWILMISASSCYGLGKLEFEVSTYGRQWLEQWVISRISSRCCQWYVSEMPFYQELIRDFIVLGFSCGVSVFKLVLILIHREEIIWWFAHQLHGCHDSPCLWSLIIIFPVENHSPL